MASIRNRGARRLSQAKRRHLRRRQQARARHARRQLRGLEQQAPSALRLLLHGLADAFTRPTYHRFGVLLLAALLTTGNHTILNVLRTAGLPAAEHPPTDHRVFSRPPRSIWRLSQRLTHGVIEHFVPDGPVHLVGDDTVDEHRGKKVFGKGRHRDAVRSSRSYTAFRYGHKWVVLAVWVRFPFTSRPWALPVLVVLYQNKDRSGKRRHKTPSQQMRQMLKVLLPWFPERTFAFAGGGGYGTHELARPAARRPSRLTLISRFYADANLCAPPPARTGRKTAGRPRVKGAKLPSPEKVVARNRQRQRLNVAWHGGGRRHVEVVAGTGHWYKAGEGLVQVSWVFVHDRTGTHRDEYFFTTDVRLTAQQVIECFTGRWSIETTFQEMRAYLGLETTRGRKKDTVLRMAPCLFGLYTVVAILFARMPARYRRVRIIDRVGKKDTTFSDAITAVRRWLWQGWVFAIPGHHAAFPKLRRPFRALLLYALAPAA